MQPSYPLEQIRRKPTASSPGPGVGKSWESLLSSEGQPIPNHHLDWSYLHNKAFILVSQIDFPFYLKSFCHLSPLNWDLLKPWELPWDWIALWESLSIASGPPVMGWIKRGHMAGLIYCPRLAEDSIVVAKQEDGFLLGSENSNAAKIY